jgi:hypothetical protein
MYDSIRNRACRIALLAAASLLSLQLGSAVCAEENEDASMSDATAYSDKAYQALIEKYAVAAGDAVDYAAWQASAADMEELDNYIRLIGRVSPTSHPELFATSDRARGYWINAYNALVLDAVLDHWPLDSVRDVTVSLTSRIVPGKGFFYDREVMVGGEQTNLLKLEEQVLESLDDPRLHFALNCASESCPVLRASDWSEADLTQAARDFVNNPENVEIVDGKLLLSRIFKWYKKDFPNDIAAYLSGYASAELAQQLTDASDEDYPVRYRDYDWSLNGSDHD